MPGDSIGKMFRVTVWGESHGSSIGAVVEGCPPGIKLDMNKIQKQLNTRKPGGSGPVSARQEQDSFEIVSGLFEGETTGTPISIVIKNQGFVKDSYAGLSDVYRPGHADFTYQVKYGIRDFFGGGRSSARLTAAVVAAGAIAEQVLAGETGFEILAYVKKVGSIEGGIASESVKPDDVRNSSINYPDRKMEEDVLALLERLKQQGNSIGGVVECVAKNVPAGFGEPLFDKLDADLAKVMVGLNAAKGIEIGSGFNGAELTGKQNNDEFAVDNGRVVTKTNLAGGVLGGISTGMPIVFRVAFKAAPSISLRQNTVDVKGKNREIEITGDHDTCVAIRAVPVVEALASIVICDHFLRYRGQCGVQ
jgi:chorismate synthase